MVLVGKFQGRKGEGERRVEGWNSSERQMEDGFCTQLYTGCIRMTMFLTGRESRWPDVSRLRFGELDLMFYSDENVLTVDPITTKSPAPAPQAKTGV